MAILNLRSMTVLIVDLVVFPQHLCQVLRGSARGLSDVNESSGPTYVDEGEECNGSLPPRFARLCKSGLFCNTSSLYGSFGTCERGAGEEHLSVPFTVGENQTCNPSLPLEFAVVCKDGLFCKTARPGASGTCVPRTEAEPISVGEGEECNGSLPPWFARLCNEGLFCNTTGLHGASGTCVRIEGGPTYVDEGEECDASLPPQFARLCNDGFFCNTTGVPGASGTCVRNLPSLNGTAYVGENETCEPSLPPPFAVLCKSGLNCMTPRPGASGVCMPQAGQSGPTYVDEGEECNGSLPPQFAKLCNEGLFCNTSGLLGSSGTCVRNEADLIRPVYVSENETCKPGLPPQFAVLCKDGLFCKTTRRGADGVCLLGEDGETNEAADGADRAP